MVLNFLRTCILPPCCGATWWHAHSRKHLTLVLTVAALLQFDGRDGTITSPLRIRHGSFPSVPGWCGPNTETVAVLEDAAREALRCMREDLRTAEARVQTTLANLQGGGRMNYQGQTFRNSRGGLRGGHGGRGNSCGHGRGGQGGGMKKADWKGKGPDYGGGDWYL
ncbi:hypothetical protein GGX14DRAFT_383911 [Mycena pura]|uniref:Uncharacterized protein n=1 Tax=Mycena pura TaxID=153505 RepID=A0AAD6YUP1_9AGAR|nr:hypothetical protein GGX14DRAFT_383911 [Mycena pura]